MIDIVSDQLSIYPNPTKGNLTISGLANSVNPTLEIYNTNGALIRSAILDGVFSSRISFELTGIENGLYYTRIRSGDKIYTMKFLLTR
jgi:flagellar hook assembly protein FlgD